MTAKIGRGSTTEGSDAFIVFSNAILRSAGTEKAANIIRSFIIL
jgi:hypothetical protein